MAIVGILKRSEEKCLSFFVLLYVDDDFNESMINKGTESVSCELFCENLCKNKIELQYKQL